MPKRILIIGVLFCISGLLAIWDIISALLESRIFLNFGVFTLPVGIGLLKGKASSRRWASLWIILGYLGSLAFAFLALDSPGNINLNFFGTSSSGGDTLAIAMISIAVWVAMLVCMHRLLYTPTSNEYFARSGKPRRIPFRKIRHPL